MLRHVLKDLIRKGSGTECYSRADVPYGSQKWRENTEEKYAQGVKDKANEGASKSADKPYETKYLLAIWENTKDAGRTATEAVVRPEEDADKARADIDKGVEDLTKKAEKKAEKDRK